MATKKAAPKALAWEKTLAKAGPAKVPRGAAPKATQIPVPESEPEPESRPLPKGFQIPKTLGACADLLYETREQRLSLTRQADLLEAAESALKQHVIDNLPKSNASGIAGRVARVAVVKKEVPKTADWSALYRSIVIDYRRHAQKGDGLEDGAFALLNRALNKATVAEHWAAQRSVPGVESFTVVMVSVSKV